MSTKKKPAAGAATRKPASVPTAAPVNTQSPQWRRVEQLASQLQQAIQQLGGGGTARPAAKTSAKRKPPARTMAAGAAAES